MPPQSLNPPCGDCYAAATLSCYVGAYTVFSGTTSTTWYLLETTGFAFEQTGVITPSVPPSDSVAVTLPSQLTQDLPFTFTYSIPSFSVITTTTIGGVCSVSTGPPITVGYGTSSVCNTAEGTPNYFLVENNFAKSAPQLGYTCTTSGNRVSSSITTEKAPQSSSYDTTEVATVVSTVYQTASQTFEGSTRGLSTLTTSPPQTTESAPVIETSTSAAVLQSNTSSSFQKPLPPSSISILLTSSSFHESLPPTPTTGLTTTSPAPINSSSISSDLSLGAKVGVGVAAPLGAIIIVLLVVLLWRQERGRGGRIRNMKEAIAQRRHTVPFSFRKGELDAEEQARNELEATKMDRELEAELVYELPAEERRGELGTKEYGQELDTPQELRFSRASITSGESSCKNLVNAT